MGELLFLAHRLPYPPDKGDKIRSWHFLRHLTARHRVHLGCFVDDPDDWAHLPLLKQICASVCAVPLRPRWRRLVSLRGLLTGAPLTFAYFADRRLAAWIAGLARTTKLDVAFAYSSGVAPLVAPDMLAVGRRIVDLVDLDSEKWRQYGAEAGGLRSWVWCREARRLAAAEAAIAGWADATLLATDPEAIDLRRRPGVPVGRVRSIANGVDAAAFDGRRVWPMPDPRLADRAPLIVFTGAMDYRPNIEAVVWFADAVLPQVRARHPSARFAIVGARPVPAVQMLASRPGILVTGRVAAIQPWLAHATLAVAPLRVARGIQNKVLEAMAMARPVVCTPEAATGIDAEAGRELIVAADAPQFAAAILALLADRARCRAIGSAARLRVQSSYDWPSKLDALDQVVAP
jgi:sugar transferase (PEP-CTERM/EpsH1 system associated)